MAASDRSLAVLKLFSLEKPEWTAEDIVAELGVSISTAYRYLSALEEVGLIATTRVGRYGLGPAIIQLDRQLQLTDPLLRVAAPVMADLSGYAPPASTVLLCRTIGNSVLCIHQVLTSGPQSQVSYARGRPMPLLYGATSKILLAYQPPRAIKAIYDANAEEIGRAGLGSSLAAFRATLAEWRRQGCIISHAEVDKGRTGIAAPILNEDRIGIGSLSFVVADTTPEPTIARLATLVSSGAREIEAMLRGEQQARVAGT